MHLRPRAARRLEAEAELDALECLNADHRRRDAAIQPAVPRHAASDTDRAAEDVRLDDPAGGVLGHLLVVDEGDHRLIRGRIGRVDLRCLAVLVQLAPVFRRDLDARHRRADAAHEAEDLDVELAEKTARQRPGGDARRGLARRSALECLAAIGRQPLDRPRQVRVPGSRSIEWRSRLEIVQPRVLVDDHHRDRRGDGLVHSHAGEKLDLVGLDFLPSAAPVAALAASKLDVDEFLVNWYARGQAFNQCQHRFPVRFAGGSVRQRCHRTRMLTEMRNHFRPRKHRG